MALTVEQLCQKAERALRGNWLSRWSGGPNHEEACDLYVEAGNKAKLQRDWPKAAECFKKAADLYKGASDGFKQAQCLTEAGNVLKRENADAAARLFDDAASIHANSGRFSQAGRAWKGLAEQYEAEGDLANALTYFGKASNVYEMDEYGKTVFTQCQLKIAAYKARLLKDYNGAIRIYEEEAKKAVTQSIGAFSAKDYLFNAALLLLAKGDDVDLQIQFERYRSLDPRFCGSREGKLIAVLLEAFTGGDEEAFVAAIAEYESITPLDDWRVHFLCAARDKLAARGKTKRRPTAAAGGSRDGLNGDSDDDDSDDLS